ncbi:MAG: exodeoxyribonuclease VII large subunit [Ignavibacteriales bacterium]|nr:MAG: exodeoxyribonuclease VII large subunit [Ignavibacteriales bacterium]
MSKINSETISVSELTKQIKLVLENEFEQVNVVGELSNFKAHYSGHWYFNLKDSDAVISCTMWKGMNNYVFFTPQDGMKVIVKGRLTLYPPRGSYQIEVRSMKPAGIGELQAAFEKLKKKLSEEGLFDDEHKRPIPFMPQKVGIVTAIDGAALKDIVSVAKRRFPLLELVIAPAKVQGSGSADSIVDALEILNQKKDIDVIIVARGGGSIEDLWSFNEEKVARAIFNSKIPVVTGVGHEVDFTIADFVSDLRAPTPSAAIEIITPDRADVLSVINDNAGLMNKTILSRIRDYKERISYSLGSYGFRLPIDLIKTRFQTLDNIIYKIIQGMDVKILITKNRLNLSTNNVRLFDIQKTLKKGFVLVKQHDKFITRAKEFVEENPAQLRFYDGDITITKK